MQTNYTTINGISLIRRLLFCTIALFSPNASLLSQQTGLTRDAATALVNEHWQKIAASLTETLESELAAETIEHSGHQMRFQSREFGEPPATGRSLFISMHGGGNAPTRVNDQQWRNQIRLYQPDEGLYIAPRAPTDTWNLWHESHIDGLFDRLILACVLCRNVDPNRVYLMGYSAGGDGVFQLAPRLADRWAAAAMMAGHPNETQPDGLRNLPFALFMGGRDSAYKRNEIATDWKTRLADLAANDPGGYPHWVQIYEDKGHWMDGQDREALPWMTKYTRTCWPKKVVWLQDDVTHQRLYWLGMPQTSVVAGAKVTAEVIGQTIEIKTDVKQIVLYLHDELLDLDQPISVRWNDREVHSGPVLRSESAIERSLRDRPDRQLVATVILELTNE